MARIKERDLTLNNMKKSVGKSNVSRCRFVIVLFCFVCLIKKGKERSLKKNSYLSNILSES